MTHIVQDPAAARALMGNRVTGIDAQTLEALIRTFDEQREVFTPDQRYEAGKHVLWANGDERGFEPGSFTSKLLHAWTQADTQNSARLAYAFPALGEARLIFRAFGADAVQDWIDGKDVS